VNEAVEAVAAQGEEAFSPEVTLSNGVRVLCKALPGYVVQRIWQQFPEPVPPMVEITEGGKTWQEPNPDDPAFQAATRQRAMDLTEAIQRVTLLMAIEILELPEGILPYEEDTYWEAEYRWVGLPVPEAPNPRYVEWLCFRVITRSEDFELIQTTCNRVAGVTEEDLAAAEKLFPGLRGRGAAE